MMAVESNYLIHHGILGQKWGIRRYENYDGTLTEAGKKRYRKLLTDPGHRDFDDFFNGSSYERYKNNTRVLEAAEKYKQSKDEVINARKKVSEDYFKNKAKYDRDGFLYWGLGADGTIEPYPCGYLSKDGWDEDQYNIDAYGKMFAVERQNPDYADSLSSVNNTFWEAKLDRRQATLEYTTDLLTRKGNRSNAQIDEDDRAARILSRVIEIHGDDTGDVESFLAYSDDDLPENFRGFDTLRLKKRSPEDVRRVDKIEKILGDRSLDPNYWEKFSESANELGYTKTTFDELTDSDWRKISENVKD